MDRIPLEVLTRIMRFLVKDLEPSKRNSTFCALSGICKTWTHPARLILLEDVKVNCIVVCEPNDQEQDGRRLVDTDMKTLNEAFFSTDSSLYKLAAVLRSHQQYRGYIKRLSISSHGISLGLDASAREWGSENIPDEDPSHIETLARSLRRIARSLSHTASVKLQMRTVDLAPFVKKFTPHLNNISSVESSSALPLVSSTVLLARLSKCTQLRELRLDSFDFQSTNPTACNPLIRLPRTLQKVELISCSGILEDHLAQWIDCMHSPHLRALVLRNISWKTDGPVSKMIEFTQDRAKTISAQAKKRWVYLTMEMEDPTQQVIRLQHTARSAIVEKGLSFHFWR